jgi:hypothetical protein
MKKLLTLTALLGVATMSYGQGLVNFANAVTASTHVSTNSAVGGAQTGKTAVAGSYYFAMFVAPTGTASNPGLVGWTPIPGVGTNTATAGRFNGNDGLGLVVPGYDAGATANFMVAGWSANLGRTWGEVSSWYQASQSPAGVPITGWFGMSREAKNMVVGGGAIPVPVLFGVSADQATGFTLGRIDPIPEPASFALAGLGAAALLIFRRRK